MNPDDLGLPDVGRRRTPGLRREDVAALAGVSVTWYTWLEQGRDIRVSDDVLDRISNALDLSADERDFLFSLVQHRPAPPLPDTCLDVSETLKRMIESLGVPAIVMTERWDIVEWNRLATVVFRDYGELEPKDRNVFRFLMLNEEYQLGQNEYEEMARRVVPKFRLDYSRSANPESFEELIADISDASETFRKIWSSPEISSKTIGLNAVTHPRLGGITFEHSTYVPEGSAGLRVMVFAPYDEASAEKLGSALAD